MKLHLLKSPGEFYQTLAKIETAVAFAGDSPGDCFSFNIPCLHDAVRQGYSLFDIHYSLKTLSGANAH